MTVSRKMSSLGTESAFEMLAKARALEAQGRDIIHLEIGEPDFDTPAHIVDEGVAALRDGYTHYGPTAGLPELRETIARNVGETRGVSVSPDQIVVTPGAKPIMFYTIMTIAQRGVEVIYPNPGFPIFESMIRFCGARPVPMPLLSENGFHPDLDALEASITDRTRLMVVNSPGNPTGANLSRRELEAIASFVRDRDDLYVLSDEIYKDIIYDGEHNSIVSLPGMAERTVILDGFSKSYAMTGWRLGYGVFPEPLKEHILKLSANSVSCAASFSQRAAIKALDGPQDGVRDMVAEFGQRRQIIARGLREIPGVECPEPEGAFYAFPNISGTGMSSQEFENRALNEAGVALLSGEAFGVYGKGCVRLSYANSQENLTRALERLKEMVVGAR